MTVAAVGAAEGAGAGAAARAGAGAAGKSAGQSASKSGGGRLSDMASGAGVGDLLGKRSSGKGGGRGGNARRLLVAEFVLCMVVLAFSPMTGKSPTASAFMKRGSAIMGVFFLLGLTSTAGRGAARASAGFGGLVTLVLLISERSIFTKLTAKFQPGVGETDSDLGGLDAQDQFDSDGGDDGDDTDRVPDPGVPPVPSPGSGLTPLPPLGPIGNGIR